MIGENHVFNPTDLDLSRSTFDLSPTVSGTFNAGRLIPIKTWFVQPGDTISMDANSLVKMSTPVYPTMDALFEDVFFFYVPFKLILGRRYGTPTLSDGNQSWQAIIGAQDNLINMPVPANGLQVPSFYLNGSGYTPGALLDYFPIYYDAANSLQLNALPLLAYFAIWNENFRDPNLMDPVTWSFNSTDNAIVPYGNVPLYATSTECTEVGRSGTASNDYLLVNALGADVGSSSSASEYANLWLPFPVCRFHGYFGSLLPWPQRNSTGVELPLGDSAPVVSTSGESILRVQANNNSGNAYATGTGIDMVANGAVASSANVNLGAIFSDGSSISGTGSVFVPITSLYTDLSSATAANVNALRARIQQQRWYEKLARSGNRYDELEYGLFGVRPHDSGDDRPKYLGGKRIPLAIEMVASTNGGTTSSGAEGAGSLGSLGAFSHTRDSDHYFYESFDDWGVVMCLACVRHHDTYGSGTDRFWTKRSRDDLYFPTFAHLGEQVTEDSELVDKASDGTVFGYNPAWQEYRSDFDRVHGLLRPGESLDFMTYAREISSGSTLKSFLNASSQVSTVDQTLQVTSVASGFQFVYQFNFDCKIRRAMPTDSIPGLMDHF